MEASISLEAFEDLCGDDVPAGQFSLIYTALRCDSDRGALLRPMLFSEAFRLPNWAFGMFSGFLFSLNTPQPCAALWIGVRNFGFCLDLWRSRMRRKPWGLKLPGLVLRNRNF